MVSLNNALKPSAEPSPTRSQQPGSIPVPTRTDKATDLNWDPRSKRTGFRKGGKREGQSLAGRRPDRQLFGAFTGSSAVPADRKATLCSPLPHLRHTEKKNVCYSHVHGAFSVMRSHEHLGLPLLEAQSCFWIRHKSRVAQVFLQRLIRRPLLPHLPGHPRGCTASRPLSYTS